MPTIQKQIIVLQRWEEQQLWKTRQIIPPALITPFFKDCLVQFGFTLSPEVLLRYLMPHGGACFPPDAIPPRNEAPQKSTQGVPSQPLPHQTSTPSLTCCRPLQELSLLRFPPLLTYPSPVDETPLPVWLPLTLSNYIRGSKNDVAILPLSNSFPWITIFQRSRFPLLNLPIHKTADILHEGVFFFGHRASYRTENVTLMETSKFGVYFWGGGFWKPERGDSFSKSCPKKHPPPHTGPGWPIWRREAALPPTGTISGSTGRIITRALPPPLRPSVLHPDRPGAWSTTQRFPVSCPVKKCNHPPISSLPSSTYINGVTLSVFFWRVFYRIVPKTLETVRSQYCQKC